MKRFLAFAFIWLVTLSMINAAPLQKRETQFGKCPTIPKIPKQPDPITVSVSPDPVTPGTNEIFSISAKLLSTITTDDKIVIEFADLLGNFLDTPSAFDI